MSNQNDQLKEATEEFKEKGQGKQNIDPSVQKIQSLNPNPNPDEDSPNLKYDDDHQEQSNAQNEKENIENNVLSNRSSNQNSQISGRGNQSSNNANKELGQQHDKSSEQQQQAQKLEQQQQQQELNFPSYQDEQAQFENINIFNDFNKLFNFFESLKTETKVCQWIKNRVNNHQSSDSDKYSNYVIQAFKNDGDDLIYMQMNVMTSQYDELIIYDSTFTLNNICLNYNSQLKIGSFIYLRQTSQIIYEIKQLQLRNQQQIKSIIENAIKHFDIMINKFIIPFKFKISRSQSTLITKHQIKRLQNTVDKTVQENSSSNFSWPYMIDEKTKLAIIPSEQEKENSYEQEKEYPQIIDQINQNIRNQEQTSKSQKSSKSKSKKKNQIANLKYSIPTLNESDLIDQGGFHKIYKTSINIGKQEPENFVVKKGGDGSKLRKEIEFINKCFQNSYSKYIAQMYQIDSKYDQYLLKFYPFKSLREYQQKYKNVMSLKRKIKILLQIVKGIQHLHKREILHLDIKPDNILISKKGNVKICDFGEAYHPRYPFQREGVKFSVPFTAPEVIINNQVTDKTDVFSFGVLACEFVFGRQGTPYMFKKDYLIQFKRSNYNLESFLKQDSESDEEAKATIQGPRILFIHFQHIIFKCKLTYILGLSPNKDDRLDINAIYEHLKNYKLQLNAI